MKINKKKLMLFGLPVLAIGLVAAVAYYVMFSSTFNITEAFTISDDTTQVFDNLVSSSEAMVITGTLLTITSNANDERVVTFTDDAPTEIVVSYVGTLELTKKDTTSWEPISGSKIEITYTVVGDTFKATGVPDGYTLIYYKDNAANADDAERLTVLGTIGSVTENLPHGDDWNAGELADYCNNGIDFYKHCRGAKLWAVPDGNIVNDALVWLNPENFYFETELIEYNTEGQITIYPNEVLDFTPVYTIAPYTVGNYEVTTEII